MVKFIAPDELLISHTDLYGIITYGNDSFSSVCEFDSNLMIGFKHNIIRHTDMPSWAFKDLWDTIKKDKEWQGIVKNSTFNGQNCYWVKSSIKPIYNNRGKKIGYESIRRQATDIEIAEAMEFYGIDLD